MEGDLRGDPSYHNTLTVPWLRQINGRDDVIIGAKALPRTEWGDNPVFIHFDTQRYRAPTGCRVG